MNEKELDNWQFVSSHRLTFMPKIMSVTLFHDKFKNREIIRVKKIN